MKGELPQVGANRYPMARDNVPGGNTRLTLMCNALAGCHLRKFTTPTRDGTSDSVKDEVPLGIMSPECDSITGYRPCLTLPLSHILYTRITKLCLSPPHTLCLQRSPLDSLDMSSPVIQEDNTMIVSLPSLARNVHMLPFAMDASVLPIVVPTFLDQQSREESMHKVSSQALS